MAMKKIFIDGKEGTTGLEIFHRLQGRAGIEIVTLPEHLRKDPDARREASLASDLTVLCLPDRAAAEAVKALEGSSARIIDASTAHRTAPGWVYGFAELNKGQAEAIAAAQRVANPGCHATGLIAALAPLVDKGEVDPSESISCFSLTGYSGGGKKMIAEYESEGRDVALQSPRIYALGQTHKHLPEMTHYCRLTSPPVFSPVVADFYRGMAVTVFLPGKAGRTPDAIADCLFKHYAAYPNIKVSMQDGAMLAANRYAGKDGLELVIGGTEGRVTVTALFDNLGKGASGAAVQNINLMLGFGQYEGLVL